MRRAAKVDANQSALARLFRAMGCSVKSTAAVGDDFPDLAIGCSGVTALVEIKDGSKPPSKQKLSEGQQKFQDTWQGLTAVVRNEEEAIELVNKIRRAGY